jgi:hypothetical protein
MRTTTRNAAAAGALLAAASFVVAAPAQAAEQPTGTTAAVNGGVLSLSAPATVVFPAANPGTVTHATLTNISVSDTRAGTTGWVASVSVTHFASAADPTRTLAASDLTYKPSPAATTGVAAVTHHPAITGATTGQPVHTATNVNGNNTATWSAELHLAIPSTALAANDYHATITHSVL